MQSGRGRERQRNQDVEKNTSNNKSSNNDVRRSAHFLNTGESSTCGSLNVDEAKTSGVSFY